MGLPHPPGAFSVCDAHTACGKRIGLYLLWVIDLYPPYSGYLLLGILLIGGIWVILSTFITRPRSKKKITAPPAEAFPDTDANATFQQSEFSTKVFPDMDVSAAFQQLAERYGITLAEGDDEFCLTFQNPDHAIWCTSDGNELTVGLMDSLHHTHFDSDREAAQQEIDDILTEKKVQMFFFDAEGAEHWNDLYSAEELDAEISARFHSVRTPEAWWMRCLRILFLYFPPVTPSMVRAEIFSYRGTYDRTVFKEAIDSDGSLST